METFDQINLVLFLGDIGLSFRTGYYLDDILVTDPRRIAHSYLG
jgi:hypothetical protein